MSDDTISSRIDAEITATGRPPVSDAQSTGLPVAAAWVANLDDDNTRALAWLLTQQSRTHCLHGVPYSIDCLQCKTSPF